MEFIDMLGTYGLIAVFIGAIACILTGAVKIPVKNALAKSAAVKKTDLAAEYVVATEARKTQIIEEMNSIEKNRKSTLQMLCNLFAAVFSLIGVFVIWYYQHRTFMVFAEQGFYKDIMSAFVVAHLVYALYENAGPKKLVLKIIDAIRSKTKDGSVVDKVLDIVEKVIGENDAVSTTVKILNDDLKMPLTQEQEKIFAEKFHESVK